LFKAASRTLRIHKFGRKEANDHIFVVTGIGKANRHEEVGSPFTVPNEYICAMLANLIGLTVPPFCVTRYEGRWYFVSMLIDEPPLKAVDPSEIVKLDGGDIASGILVFDIFIANNDRKEKDLWLDPHIGEVVIFDHSHALLGYERGVSERLRLLENELGILGDGKCPDHCLLEHIETDAFFPKWIERIKSLRPDIIDEIVEEGCRYANSEDHPLSSNDIENLKSFLKRRKGRIEELIKRHKDKFKRMQWSSL